LERGARHFRWRVRVPAYQRILRAAAAAALLSAAAQDVQAAFDAPTVSAQAAAMGGASLAGQGDSAALFLNPAGGSGLQAPEAYFMYNQLFTGLGGAGGIGQGLATFGVPTRIGAIGIGLSEFQAAGLLDERMIGVSYARRLFGAVDVGVTGKYLYQNYLIGSSPSAAADPIFANGSSRSAFALDLGVIAPATDDLKLGLAVRNINQPNIGLMTSDPVARQIQGGLRYDVRPYDLRLTADYTYVAAQAGNLSLRSQPSIGIEKGFENGRVVFRAGLTADQFSGGIGIQLGPLGLDYTFILNSTVLANNAGTQMVGLRYRFGDDAQSAPKEH
jgi:hypothetical protein